MTVQTVPFKRILVFTIAAIRLALAHGSVLVRTLVVL